MCTDSEKCNAGENCIKGCGQARDEYLRSTDSRGTWVSPDSLSLLPDPVPVSFFPLTLCFAVNVGHLAIGLAIALAYAELICPSRLSDQ